MDTKKKKNERSQKKKTSARHKGGQLGNKNAVGIKGGPLKPGDKIPTEMALSEQLGVARNSIREAIKILVYIGVLEI